MYITATVKPSNGDCSPMEMFVKIKKDRIQFSKCVRIITIQKCMYVDKDLREQWKMKQVNVSDSGTGTILLFSVFNLQSVAYTVDKKRYL